MEKDKKSSEKQSEVEWQAFGKEQEAQIDKLLIEKGIKKQKRIRADTSK